MSDTAEPQTIRIVRLGEIAARFLAAHRRARVAAVFERSLYLAADGDFVCLGTGIGNGPLNAVVDGDAAAGWLGGIAVGQWIEWGASSGHSAGDAPPASCPNLNCSPPPSPPCLNLNVSPSRGRWPVGPEGGRAIGGPTIDPTCAAIWRPDPWPAAAHLALRQAALQRVSDETRSDAPPDGLSRLVLLPATTSIDDSAVSRVARPRIARIVSWLDVELSASAPPPLRPYGPPPPQGGRGTLSVGGLDRWNSCSVWRHFNGHPPPPVDLLGLGPGLTPSGDDVLCGVLIALDAIGGRQAASQLAAAIRHAAPQATTPLSAAFLAAAAEGQGAETLHCFIAAAIAADLDTLPGTIAELGGIGHTSGWDAMAGAVLVLRAAGESPAAPLMQSP